MSNDNDMKNFFGKMIFSYTRKQAIEDGILIDVSKTANEAGFKIPVAVAESVWRNYIEWTNKDSETQTYQDTDGRLWDILSILKLNISKCRSDVLIYKLYIIPRDGKSKKTKLTTLKATMGAGDNGEPVITIMLPTED